MPQVEHPSVLEGDDFDEMAGDFSSKETVDACLQSLDRLTTRLNLHKGAATVLRNTLTRSLYCSNPSAFGLPETGGAVLYSDVALALKQHIQDLAKEVQEAHKLRAEASCMKKFYLNFLSDEQRERVNAAAKEAKVVRSNVQNRDRSSSLDDFSSWLLDAQIDDAHIDNCISKGIICGPGTEAARAESASRLAGKRERNPLPAP
jgi:hypothetical protein